MDEALYDIKYHAKEGYKNWVWERLFKPLSGIGTYKRIKLVKSQDKYTTYVMKPMFREMHPYSMELTAVEIGKSRSRWASQNSLSKMLMYKFHYNQMQPKYGRKVKLWYMETDSFVYEIEKEGFYWDIAKDVETVV